MTDNEIRPSTSLAEMIRDYQPHRVIEGHHPDYNHIVGWFRWWVARLLRRVPRALCGELLCADPDRPDVPPDAPFCPVCLERNGSAPVQHIPGYWL